MACAAGHRTRRGARLDRGIPGRASTQGPAALVLSGEAGIGKTILWEAGVEQAERALRPRPDVPRSRGRGPAVVRRALGAAGARRCDETAAALAAAAPPRARGRAAARRAGRAGSRCARHRACRARRAADPRRARPRSRRPRRRPVARSRPPPACSRSRSAACARSRSACSRPSAQGQTWQPRSSSSARSRASGLQRLSLGPLGLGALRQPARGSAGARADAAGARSRAGGDGGQPVLRARARSRARPHRTPGPTPGQALRVPESLRELLGGRLARLPGETLDVLLAGGSAGAADRRAGRGGARRSGARPRRRSRRRCARASSSSTTHASASPIPCSHRSVTSRRRVWKRRAVHRALAGAVKDVEERARHLALAAEGPDAAVASDLDAAAEQAAARGRDRRRGRALGARRRPDAGRSRPRARRRRLQAATFYRLAGDADLAAAMLEQLLDEVPPGVERADVLFALATTFSADPGRLSSSATRRWPRRAATTCGRIADPGLAKPRPLVAERHARRRSHDARAALEKAERVGDPVLVAVAIARVGQAETCGRRGHSRPARARRRDRGAPRALARVLRQPARLAHPAPDASGRDRMASHGAGGDGEEGGRRGATRGRGSSPSGP